jgi:MFS transporter, PPP family, 3-phenylpropionic acid transporter
MQTTVALKQADRPVTHAHTLLRFVALYALMYGAFGVSSPFMPAFFEGRGLTAEQLGALFGTGTAIRLISGPVFGRLADLTQALRGVLAMCTVLAAVLAVALLRMADAHALFAISVLQAAALAPITTLADALAVGAGGSRPVGARFEYGWVRGTGSGAFIVGTLVSGQVVGAWGLGSILVLHAALLTLAGVMAPIVPALPRPNTVAARSDPAPREGIVGLLRVAGFRRVILVATLVLGSHAMHDTFAVIRWSAAGVNPATVSVLWSESVAAEVVVFFLIGPWLVRRLGAGGVMALAATAGLVRWVVAASTTDVTALALVQPLHGLTFAALHLACMRVIPAVVPPGLAATAQATYALGPAAATAVLTLASGHLYAHLGGRAFLAMALLCAAATPLALMSRARWAADEWSGSAVDPPSGDQRTIRP